jgi:hypothetical protein
MYFSSKFVYDTLNVNTFAPVNVQYANDRKTFIFHCWAQVNRRLTCWELSTGDWLVESCQQEIDLLRVVNRRLTCWSQSPVDNSQQVNLLLAALNKSISCWQLSTSQSPVDNSQQVKKTKKSVGNIGRVGFFSLFYHWKNVADLANNASIHRCVWKVI